MKIKKHIKSKAIEKEMGFEFDKLEYPSYCVRQFNINTKHKQDNNELANILSSKDKG